LTLEGAHRVIGYDLEGLRSLDRELNAARTHITAPSPRDFQHAIQLASMVS
jgi:hypothetical protein